ncbi:MAG: hypothetical protein U0X73_09435 [Thermoanaerobaculia bacterium]
MTARTELNPRRALLAATLALAATATAQAQTGGHEYYALHQEVVMPSQVATYEATSREFVAFVQANRTAMKDFSAIAIQGENFSYLYAVPISAFAGVDTINGDFAAVFSGPAAQQAADLFARNSATLSAINEWVVERYPELSYAPATPRLKPGEASFVHYDLYYLQPGAEDQAKAIAKDFVALFKRNNWPDGYNLFMTAMGPDMPLLVVEVPDKTAADYYAHNQAMRTALGAEAQALFGRAFAITRKFETRNGWLRPDLSIPPAK